MIDDIYGIYEYIIQNSDSAIIVLLIVLILAFVIAIIPLYIQIRKGRKEDKSHERAEKQQIIEVIKENSVVMAGVKAVLDNIVQAQKVAWERIHGRIDDTNNILMRQGEDYAKSEVKLDKCLANQTEMASKINKVLLIVDAMPNNSNFSSQKGGNKGNRVGGDI